MRLIDADALIEKAHHEAQCMSEPFKEQFGVLVEWLVEKTPTIEPEQKWIPCSERLPEYGRYLVNYSLSVFSPQVMNYSDGEWYYDGCQSMDLEIPTINAWMSLPELYKGDSK